MRANLALAPLQLANVETKEKRHHSWLVRWTCSITNNAAQVSHTGAPRARSWLKNNHEELDWDLLLFRRRSGHDSVAVGDLGKVPGVLAPDTHADSASRTGGHRSQGLPVIFELRLGGQAGTCQCWFSRGSSSTNSKRGLVHDQSSAGQGPRCSAGH